MAGSRHAILATGLALFLVGASGACAELKPPTIDYFWANPSRIVVGDSAALTWGVSDASTVTIDQKVGGVASVGTATVSPTETTSYTLTAANGDESVSSSVVITVTAPPPPTPPEENSDGAAEEAGGDTQGTAREITMEDIAQLLDLSSDLPTRFEREDAATAGLTIPDLGLGLEFSGMTVFLSAEPMQAVAAVMMIVRGMLLQVGVDTLLQNEDMFVSLVRSEIEMRLAAEGLDISDYDVDIDFSHPAIGDAAILGRGVVDADGVVVGYEAVTFRNGEVVVFCASSYLGDGIGVLSLASAIDERIEELRH